MATKTKIRKSDTDRPKSSTRKRKRAAETRSVARPLVGRLVAGTAKIGTLMAIWGLVAVGGILAYYAYQLPDISNLDRQTRASSVELRDRSGKLFASYGALHGDPVVVTDLPKALPAALLATEDRRFREHFGFDPISFARALWINVTTGRIRQGGSTITQQLAKNVFLTRDRSLKRKVQELLLAFWLERNFTKDQILSIYLNRVYFGAGTYGVDAAARKYFGKSARRVGLYESAMLVGLLKAPSRYNPVVNAKLSRGRTRQVLMNMAAAGYLTERQAKAAAARPVVISGAAATSRGRRHFADWALEATGGLVGPEAGDRIVVTTLDARLQSLAEQSIARGLKGFAKSAEAAMVVMTSDGAVRAMVGGRDYANSQFNRAVQALRQPGSAFKPVIYLAALASGMTPASEIDDGPVSIGKWKPRNFSGKHHGIVSLKQALAGSYNSAAIRLSEQIGRRSSISLARQLGYVGSIGDGAGFVLGTGEASPLQMTTLYAGLAAGGRPALAHGIAEIRDRNGRSLYQNRPANLAAVVPDAAIYDLTTMLRAVVEGGTGKAARIGRPAAGKTGTSQDNRDAWFVGYTAELVAGVWIGRDDARPMKGVTGGGAPARIWADFMRRALKGTAPRDLLAGTNWRLAAK